MARIRTIKPEIWHDEFFASLPYEGRLLWIGLITQADDEGRLRGNPNLLRSMIFPYDTITGKRIETILRRLEQGCLILRYEARGEAFIQLAKWSKHQRINRPSESLLPAPPSLNGAGEMHASITADSVSAQ